MQNRSPPLAWISFGLVALATSLAYLPGLHGGFLFDDFANLPPLGETGPITHWPIFWRYITSGTADPTGRPLALLSFLIDARNWPADPFPFKRTNLVLHLVNGALLFALLRRLGRLRFGATSSASRADIAAALGAGLWLAHPLLVSTTLYIVQREAMLPATFTLLGLLGWLRGRELLCSGRTARGVIGIVLGLGACTALAVLSKANGILLPALALVLEYTVVRPAAPMPENRPPRSTYAVTMAVFAWLPAVLVTVYLLHAGWKGITVGISDVRPWTLAQRLLTEPRVLLTYLHMLWLPTPFTAGLFNDQLKASASLLSPWTTLPCLLAVAALIVGTWRLRLRWPALAAAVLFFFVGQSIESSTVALELFFEHRNYLPAMLMFWPLALWLCDVAPFGASADRSRRRLDIGKPLSEAARRRGKAALAIVAMIALLAMTWSRASLWGNTRDQALLWARLNPHSARAQAYAAQAEMGAGHPDRAIQRLEPALAQAPGELQLALNLLAARCATGRLDPDTLATARQALATSRDGGSLLSSWFRRAIGQAQTERCTGLDLPAIDALLLAAQGNPHLTDNHGRQQDIDYLRGLIALRQREPDRALALFDAGLREQPRASLVLSQAAELGASGYPAQGLAHLDTFARLPPPPEPHGWSMRRLHAWVLAKQRYWPQEMARLRATLENDLNAGQAAPR